MSVLSASERDRIVRYLVYRVGGEELAAVQALAADGVALAQDLAAATARVGELERAHKLTHVEIDSARAFAAEQENGDLRTRLATAEGRVRELEDAVADLNDEGSPCMQRMNEQRIELIYAKIEAESQVGTLRAALERVGAWCAERRENAGYHQIARLNTLVADTLATTDPSGVAVVREAIRALHETRRLTGSDCWPGIDGLIDTLAARFGTPGEYQNECRCPSDEGEHVHRFTVVVESISESFGSPLKDRMIVTRLRCETCSEEVTR